MKFTTAICVICCCAIFALTGCNRPYTNAEQELSTRNMAVTLAAPAGFDYNDFRMMLFAPGGNFIREVENITKSAAGNTYTYGMNIAVGNYDLVMLANTGGVVGPLSAGDAPTKPMYRVNDSGTNVQNAREYLYTKLPNVTITRGINTFNNVVLDRNVAKVRVVIVQSNLSPSATPAPLISLKNYHPVIDYRGKVTSEVMTKTLPGTFTITADPLVSGNYISDTLTFIIPANRGTTTDDVATTQLKFDFTAKRLDGTTYTASDVVVPAEPRANKIMLIRLNVEPNMSLTASVTFNDWNTPVASSGNIVTGVTAGQISVGSSAYLKTSTSSVTLTESTAATAAIGAFTYSWTRKKDTDATATALSATSSTYTETITSLPAGRYTYTRTITDRYGNTASSSVNVYYKDPLVITKQPAHWYSLLTIATGFYYFQVECNDPYATFQWRKAGINVVDGVGGTTSRYYPVGLITNLLGVNYSCVVSNEFSSSTSTNGNVVAISTGNGDYLPTTFSGYSQITIPGTNPPMIIMSRNLGASADYNPSSPNVNSYGNYFQWACEVPFSPTILTPTFKTTKDTKSTLWKTGPCPSGWHVMSTAEWAIIRAQAAANATTIYNLIKLPPAGELLPPDGLLQLLPFWANRGTIALIWLREVTYNGEAVSDTYAKAAQIDAAHTGFTLRNKEKLEGLPVRCVKN